MGWPPQTPMSNGKEKIKLGLLRFSMLASGAAAICLELNYDNILLKAVILSFLEFFSHSFGCLIHRVVKKCYLIENMELIYIIIYYILLR